MSKYLLFFILLLSTKIILELFAAVFAAMGTPVPLLTLRRKKYYFFLLNLKNAYAHFSILRSEK